LFKWYFMNIQKYRHNFNKNSYYLNDFKMLEKSKNLFISKFLYLKKQ
jgi:hypothetical protein